MQEERILHLLEQVRSGQVDVNAALSELRTPAG